MSVCLFAFLRFSDMSADDVMRLERQILLGELNETASDIGAVMMKVDMNIFQLPVSFLIALFH